MDGIVPYELEWLAEPAAATFEDGQLAITAGPRTDLFIHPGTGDARRTAPALVGSVLADFQLSARVEVDFAADFDAGALIVWRDEATWAKVCFEFSPQHEAMVVSVVTRGASDDANSVVIDGNAVWLRISRMGDALAFHSSSDGGRWSFVRHFALPGVPGGAAVRVGFVAQSPTGEGCAVRFSDVRFTETTLAELRDGS